MMNEEVQECLNCKHKEVKTDDEPCITCIKKGQRVNWESTTTIIKKEESKEEKPCNGCSHEGKTAFDAPCNECTRRRKDLFELPKKLVKRTYYFTSWACVTDKDVRVFTPGYLDKSRVFTPDHKFTKHTIEIEEEE